MLARPTILTTILSLIFSSFTAYGDSSASGTSQTTASEIPKVVILGEAAHNNTNLASEVLSLLRSLQGQNFNCLFVEFPSDLAPAFASSVRAGHMGEIYRATLELTISSYVSVLKTRDAPESYFDKMEETIREQWPSIVETFAVNDEVLKYLKLHNVLLLPFDARSSSAEMVEFRKLDVSGQLDGNGDDYELDRYRNDNKRNEIMAENIVRGFSVDGCHSAVVVVGIGHLRTDEWMRQTFGQEINFVPLQARLNNRGLSVRILSP